MIIFANGTWQTRSDCPDSNWLADDPAAEQPQYVIDDDSDIAKQIRSAPLSTVITDEDGSITGIEPMDFPAPTAEEQAAQRKTEITARLAELDSLEIRPLAAIAAGSGTDEDRARLAAYEAEKAALRAELSELE